MQPERPHSMPRPPPVPTVPPQSALLEAQADSDGAGCGVVLTVAAPPRADGFVSIVLGAQPTTQ
eukprot:321927-Chlamydomonas_euryale.AAC.1